MSATILQFPPRNKGRIRKSRSPWAMGRCSFSLVENDGQAVPPNVADIRAGRDARQVDDGRLALRLALSIFATLTAEQKKQIRSVTRSIARHEDGQTGDEARALYRLLTGEALPC